MKILYGVQGTGNGHISRASSMFEAFRNYPELKVTWLLSGRDRQRGCGAIEHFEWRSGLTFITENGKINLIKTARQNKLGRFWRDVSELDVKGYDLLITDFEPVLAHAARKRGMPVVGIGHQYAFRYSIPLKNSNVFVKGLMDAFAPATRSVGLHWHHFGHPILPPIVDVPAPTDRQPSQSNKVIVYLPFENLEGIQALFRQWPEYQFYIYHPEVWNRNSDHHNLHLRCISREGFKHDLVTSSRVITNSGFELISECLQLGKAILTKPLQGQMEQHSNAAALEQLGYAAVLDKLDPPQIRQWLKADIKPIQLAYPDVAAALAQWVAGGCTQTEQELAAQLWQ